VAAGGERLGGRDTGHAGADHGDPHRAASAKELCGAEVEMVQDRVWPAILFGFFSVAMRLFRQPGTVIGENGVGSE